MSHHNYIDPSQPTTDNNYKLMSNHLQQRQKTKKYNQNHLIRQVQSNKQLDSINKKYYQSHHTTFKQYENDKSQMKIGENVFLKQIQKKYQQKIMKMIQQHNGEIERNRHEWQQKFKKIEQEKNKIDMQLKKQTNLNVTYKQKIQTYKTQIAQLTGKNKRLQEQLQGQVPKFKQRQQLRKRLQKQNIALKQQIAAQRTDINRMNTQLNDNSKNILRSYQIKVSQLQNDKNNFNSDIANCLKVIQTGVWSIAQQILKLSMIQPRQCQQMKKIKSIKLMKLGDVKQFINKIKNNTVLIVNNANKNNNTIKDKLTDRQKQLKNKTIQIDLLTKQLSNTKQLLQQTLDKLKQSQQKLTNTQNKLRQTQKKLADTIVDYNKLKSKLQNQIILLKNTIEKHLQTINKLQTKVTSLQSKIKSHQNTINKQNDTISVKTIEIKAKEQQIKMKLRQIGDWTSKNNQKDAEITKLTLVIKNKDQQIRRLNNKVFQLQRQIKSLKQKLQSALSTISKLQIIQKNQIQQIKDLKITINTKNNQIKYLQNKQSALNIIQKQFISQITYQISGESQMIDEENINKSITNVKQKIINGYYQEKYFNNSQCIPKNKVGWLVEKIEDFNNAKVVCTKLVYKFDQQNKANFHNYFDKKDNIIIVIKLSNGTQIGGFSVYPFQQKSQTNIQDKGKGFLFNINRSTIYKMRPNPAKAVTGKYDPYYFLLGNAQIRIKSQQKKLFSNFGIAAATFNTNNDNRTLFLNDENNQIDMQGYQIYQIFLN